VQQWESRVSTAAQQLPPIMQVAYSIGKTQQTDIDGPIRCSSLMLVCEEHLKNETFTYVKVRSKTNNKDVQ
jgi:hypothetical protein